jgi:hypothetical protein
MLLGGQFIKLFLLEHLKLEHPGDDRDETEKEKAHD